MKRFSIRPADVTLAVERGNDATASDWKCGLNLVNLMAVFLISVMVFSVLFSLSVMLRDPPEDALWTVTGARSHDFDHHNAIPQEDILPQRAQALKDNTFSDLLPTGFDEKPCRSRHESILYRQGHPPKASPYLISRLRRYEALHKKCGPYTVGYNRSVKYLKYGKYLRTSDCKYVVWISFSGLGNRILTIASAFLYALLTNRVLLVDRGNDIPDLFCEPFPKVSWLLPLDFPLRAEVKGFNQKSNVSYGNLLKSHSVGNLTSSARQPYIYVHLVHDYDDQDKLFFCDQDRTCLRKTPWLIMKSDNYFIPYLFLIPSFQQELHNLFPDKETVFHLLGQYLFHPSNSVWGLITRYYRAYLSKADVKIGIQVRVFEYEPGPFKHVLDQILSCTMKENILPQLNKDKPIMDPSQNQKTVAVLMTSLDRGYFEQVRDLYWENPTETGEVIAVYQPSDEGYQQTEKHHHNRKALAEMYLLSLTDKLVTSSWSTFGYVAQGFGGLKPWILYKPENHTMPDPPCRRATSVEPCFHAPPFYDCKLKRGADTGAIVPHVKHCEDMSWGLKLIKSHDEL